MKLFMQLMTSLVVLAAAQSGVATPGETSESSYQAVMEDAVILNASKNKIEPVELSTTRILNTVSMTSAEALDRGGRQNAIAAVVPPEKTVDGLGQKRVRVPGHELYSAEDAKNLASTLVGKDPTAAQVYLESADADLVEYMQLISFYVQVADSQPRNGMF